MAHELIHAFDDCRAKVDFANIDHVACTEVRRGRFIRQHLDKVLEECLGV